MVYIGGQQGVSLASDRGLTFDEHQPGPDDRRTPTASEIVTMGLKGSDITHLQERRHRRLDGTIVALAESPKTAGVLYAGTDDGTLQVTQRRRQELDDVYQKLPGAPKGGYVSRVAPSRFDAGTVYATFDNHRLERLRDLHLREPRTTARRGVAQRQPQGRGRSRRITEDQKNPGRALRRRGNGAVRVDRSRRRAGAGRSGTCRRCASTKIIAASARQRDVLATHGRAIWVLDHARADPGVRGGAGDDDRREAVHAAAVVDVPPPGARSQLRVLGRPGVLRREPAAVGRASRGFVQEQAERRQAEDHRCRPAARCARSRCRRTAAKAGDPARRAGICACSRVPTPRLRRARGPRWRPAVAAGRTCRSRRIRRRAIRSAYGCGAGGGGGWRLRRRRRRQPGTDASSAAPTPWRWSSTARRSRRKPLRVVGDPEVVLTEAQRKQLFDMAMEMHDLQKRAHRRGGRRAPRSTGRSRELDDRRSPARPTSRPT